MITYELRDLLDPRDYFSTLEWLDYWGNSIALNGDGTVLVASVLRTPDTYGEGDVNYYGGIYTYDYNADGHVWIQRGDVLLPPAGTPIIGRASWVDLSADGTLLVVGQDYKKDVTETYTPGAAYVYSRVDDGWALIYALDNPRGTNNNDRFGMGVSISGDGMTICIGAPYADVGGTGTEGALYTYGYGDDTPRDSWIGGSVGGTELYLGGASALSGDGSVLAIGHYLFESTNYVEIYDKDGDGWSKRYEISGTELFGQAGMEFGSDVSLSYDGTKLLVGGRSYTTSDEYEDLGGSRYTASYEPLETEFPTTEDPLWDSVFSLFRCDTGDLVGSALTDTSQYGTDAFAEGGLSIETVSGAIGQALEFGDYISMLTVSYSLGENFGNSPWCYEIRFLAPVTLGAAAYIWYVNSYNYAKIVLDSGVMKLQIRIGALGIQTGTLSISAGVWHSLVVDFDTAVVRTFIDGSLDLEETVSPALSLAETSWSIYGWDDEATGSFFVDEVRFSLGRSVLVDEGFGNEGLVVTFSLGITGATLYGAAETTMPQQSGYFGRSVALATQTENLFAASSMYDFNGACLGDGTIEVYNLELSPPSIELCPVLVERGKVLAIPGAISNAIFGRSIAMSMDTVWLAISRKYYTSSDSSCVFIYKRVSGAYEYQYVTMIPITYENFGEDVSLNANGSILVVGQSTYPENTIYSGYGRVYVFSRDDDTGESWTQTATIDRPGGNEVQCYFGSSVAISGNGLVLVVASDEAYSDDRGAVWTFDYNAETEGWDHREPILSSMELYGQYFGSKVALNYDGSVLAVASEEFYDVVTEYITGKVFIFDYASSPGEWTLRASRTGELNYEHLGIGGVPISPLFGNGMDMTADGAVVAVSEYYNWADNTEPGFFGGRVRLFNTSDMSELNTVTPPQDMWTLPNTDEFDFGWDIALSEAGDVAVFSTLYDPTISETYGTNNTGRLYIYTCGRLIVLGDCTHTITSDFFTASALGGCEDVFPCPYL